MDAVTSMEEQLAELTQEKAQLSQAFPGLEVRELIELSRDVQGQLDALISDQVDALVADKAKLDAALPGLTIDYVIELASAELFRRTGSAGGSDPKVESLSQQLSKLYSEKEILEREFPGLTPAEIAAEIQDKVKLLEQFSARKR